MGVSRRGDEEEFFPTRKKSQELYPLHLAEAPSEAPSAAVTSAVHNVAAGGTIAVISCEGANNWDLGGAAVGQATTGNSAPLPVASHGSPLDVSDEAWDQVPRGRLVACARSAYLLMLVCACHVDPMAESTPVRCRFLRCRF